MCGSVSREGTRSYEFGRRHPVLTAVLVDVLLMGVIALFVGKLALARRSMPAEWADPAGIGAVASLIVGGAAVAAGRVRRLGGATRVIGQIVGLCFLAEYFYALNLSVPVRPGTASAISVAAFAVPIPSLAGLAAVIGWAAARRGAPKPRVRPGVPPGAGALAPVDGGRAADPMVVICRQRRGWLAFWMDDGLRKIRGPALSEVAEQACAAVAGGAAADGRPRPAICVVVAPGKNSELGLEVTGEPGALAVADPLYGALPGATLEDLLDAVRQVRGNRAGYALIWTRQPV